MIRSLGQEDALEEEMATHSSILAWKIPWTEDPGGLLSMGSQRVGCDVVTKQQHTTLPPTATSPAAMEVTVLGKNPLPDQHTAPQCRRSRRHVFDPWVGKMPWRRKWQPTPVCFPGESHGQRSLEGYSPWGHKESDITEAT